MRTPLKRFFWNYYITFNKLSIPITYNLIFELGFCTILHMPESDYRFLVAHARVEKEIEDKLCSRDPAIIEAVLKRPQFDFTQRK